MLTSLTPLVTLASSEGGNTALHFAVGGIAFGILMISLLAVMAFGGGREHS